VWRTRGRADTCAGTLRHDLEQATGLTIVRSTVTLAEADEMPNSLGDFAFHCSHQSALVRKDPGHYRRWFYVSPDLPYVRPKSDRDSRSA
jgi:hypothetical protein